MKIKTKRHEGRATLAIMLSVCLLTSGFLILRAFACQNQVASKTTQKAPCTNSSTPDCKPLTNPPPTCSYYEAKDSIFCDCGSGNCQDQGGGSYYVVSTFSGGTCVDGKCNTGSNPPTVNSNYWDSLKTTFGCE